MTAGGDYDTLRISETEVAWSLQTYRVKEQIAAFHMSQMKGIFIPCAAGAQSAWIHEQGQSGAGVLFGARLIYFSRLFCCWYGKEKSHIRVRVVACVVFTKHRKTKQSTRKDKRRGIGHAGRIRYGKLIESRTISYCPNDVIVLLHRRYKLRPETIKTKNLE